MKFMTILYDILYEILIFIITFFVSFGLTILVLRSLDITCDFRETLYQDCSKMEPQKITSRRLFGLELKEEKNIKTVFEILTDKGWIYFTFRDYNVNNGTLEPTSNSVQLESWYFIQLYHQSDAFSSSVSFGSRRYSIIYEKTEDKTILIKRDNDKNTIWEFTCPTAVMKKLDQLAPMLTFYADWRAHYVTKVELAKDLATTIAVYINDKVEQLSVVSGDDHHTLRAGWVVMDYYAHMVGSPFDVKFGTPSIGQINDAVINQKIKLKEYLERNKTRGGYLWIKPLYEFYIANLKESDAEIDFNPMFLTSNFVSFN